MKKKYVAGFIVFLAVIWVVTYVAWSKHLDNKIAARFEEMLEEVEDSEVVGIHLIQEGIELSELTDDTELPTITEIRVSYTDKPDEEKQAYVVYADVQTPVYEDDKYGKIILPSEWK